MNVLMKGKRDILQVTDLEPNTRYLVTVRAVTRAGMGPPSASVTVTIPVVPPPGIPASVRPPSTHNPKTDQHLGKCFLSQQSVGDCRHFFEMIK